MHSDSISVGCCSSSSALIGRNKCPGPGCRAGTGEGAAAAPGSPGSTAPLANMTTRSSGPNFGLLRLSWPHPFLRHFRQLPPRPSLKRPRTPLGEQYVTRFPSCRDYSVQTYKASRIQENQPDPGFASTSIQASLTPGCPLRPRAVFCSFANSSAVLGSISPQV